MKKQQKSCFYKTEFPSKILPCKHTFEDNQTCQETDFTLQKYVLHAKVLFGRLTKHVLSLIKKEKKCLNWWTFDLDFVQPGGDPLVLCFVDFLSPAHAATAMEALQGKVSYSFMLEMTSSCMSWKILCSLSLFP